MRTDDESTDEVLKALIREMPYDEHGVGHRQRGQNRVEVPVHGAPPANAAFGVPPQQGLPVVNEQPQQNAPPEVHNGYGGHDYHGNYNYGPVVHQGPAHNMQYRGYNVYNTAQQGFFNQQRHFQLANNHEGYGHQGPIPYEHPTVQNTQQQTVPNFQEHLSPQNLSVAMDYQYGNPGPSNYHHDPWNTAHGVVHSAPPAGYEHNLMHNRQQRKKKKRDSRKKRVVVESSTSSEEDESSDTSGKVEVAKKKKKKSRKNRRHSKVKKDKEKENTPEPSDDDTDAEKVFEKSPKKETTGKGYVCIKCMHKETAEKATATEPVDKVEHLPRRRGRPPKKIREKCAKSSVDNSGSDEAPRYKKSCATTYDMGTSERGHGSAPKNLEANQVASRPRGRPRKDPSTGSRAVEVQTDARPCGVNNEKFMHIGNPKSV